MLWYRRFQAGLLLAIQQPRIGAHFNGVRAIRMILRFIGIATLDYRIAGEDMSKFTNLKGKMYDFCPISWAESTLCLEVGTRLLVLTEGLSLATFLLMDFPWDGWPGLLSRRKS